MNSLILKLLRMTVKINALSLIGGKKKSYIFLTNPCYFSDCVFTLCVCVFICGCLFVSSILFVLVWVSLVAQFSCLVMSNSLRPHGPQLQASLSITSSWGLLSFMSVESVMPANHLILCRSLLLLPSIFPSIRVISNGGQSIAVSASASIRPVNIQDWFSLGWTGWISLQSKGLSRVFSKTTVQKHQFFSAQLSLQSSFHIQTWLLEKP